MTRDKIIWLWLKWLCLAYVTSRARLYCLRHDKKTLCTFKVKFFQLCLFYIGFYFHVFFNMCRRNKLLSLLGFELIFWIEVFTEIFYKETKLTVMWDKLYLMTSAYHVWNFTKKLILNFISKPLTLWTFDLYILVQVISIQILTTTRKLILYVQVTLQYIISAGFLWT